MYNGTLTKLSRNKNALRTSEVEGFFFELPEPGESFTIYSKGLEDEKDLRFVETSIVREIFKDDGAIKFTTLNSAYRLTYSKEK